jgi:hypothetical protein
MFLMHAFYGLGATISPLVSTEFVKRVQSRVYLYFCVSLGMAIMTASLLILVFRGRTDDQVVGTREPDTKSPGTELKSREATQANSLDTPSSTMAPAASHTTPGSVDKVDVEAAVSTPSHGGSGGKMKSIIAMPSVHYMAFYIMIYVGVEVTIGGWAVSCLCLVRGPSS